MSSKYVCRISYAMLLVLAICGLAAANEAPTAPVQILCNGQPCAGAYSDAVTLECSGSTDPEQGSVTYIYEAQHLDAGTPEIVFSDDGENVAPNIVVDVNGISSWTGIGAYRCIPHPEAVYEGQCAISGSPEIEAPLDITTVFGSPYIGKRTFEAYALVPHGSATVCISTGGAEFCWNDDACWDIDNTWERHPSINGICQSYANYFVTEWSPIKIEISNGNTASFYHGSNLIGTAKVGASDNIRLFTKHSASCGFCGVSYIDIGVFDNVQFSAVTEDKRWDMIGSSSGSIEWDIGSLPDQSNVIFRCKAVDNANAESGYFSSQGTRIDNLLVKQPCGSGGCSLAASTASLTVPPGAIPSTETITIDKGDDETFASYSIGYSEDMQVAGTWYEFGPHGIVFDTPITITISYEQGNMIEGGAEEQSMDIYYYDPVEGWIAQNAAQDMDTNTLTLQVSHFSSYAPMYIKDSDGDGYVNVNDCDKNDASINPGASEICDGKDNDCDGSVDEEALFGVYFDADSDSYGAGEMIYTCALSGQYSTTAGDCSDYNPSINPGAAEICNGIDDDCDTLADEGGVCDSEAPITTDDYAYSGVWSNVPASITLTATDNTAVAGTKYCFVDINGLCFEQDYNAPVSIAADGFYTIRYWSLDTFGNIETAKSIDAMLDLTKPEISLSLIEDTASACGFWLQWWTDTGMVNGYNTVHGCTRIEANVNDALSGVSGYAIKIMDANGNTIASSSNEPLNFNFETNQHVYKIVLEASDNAGNFATIAEFAYEDDDKDVFAFPDNDGGAPDMFDLCPSEVPSADSNKDGCNDAQDAPLNELYWCMDTYAGVSALSIYPISGSHSIGSSYSEDSIEWFNVHSSAGGASMDYDTSVSVALENGVQKRTCLFKPEVITTSSGQALAYSEHSASKVRENQGEEIKSVAEMHKFKWDDGSRVHASMRYSAQSGYSKLLLVYENKEKEMACNEVAQDAYAPCTASCAKTDKACRQGCQDTLKNARIACRDAYHFNVKGTYSGMRTLSAYDILKILGYE